MAAAVPGIPSPPSGEARVVTHTPADPPSPYCHDIYSATCSTVHPYCQVFWCIASACARMDINISPLCVCLCSLLLSSLLPLSCVGTCAQRRFCPAPGSRMRQVLPGPHARGEAPHLPLPPIVSSFLPTFAAICLSCLFLRIPSFCAASFGLVAGSRPGGSSQNSPA